MKAAEIQEIPVKDVTLQGCCFVLNVSQATAFS
jgi:hypothetical protein